MKEYVSERVINIAPLERLIHSAYYSVAGLRRELEKESPSMERIDELSRQAHLDLLQAKDYEFCVERRKTVEEVGEYDSNDVICQAVRSAIDGIAGEEQGT